MTDPFQAVLADPAWRFRDDLPGDGRGASKHYATMTTRDLCALGYRLPPIATDALLFLWRVASMPFDGLDVCRAWGFEPVSEIVWVKTPKSAERNVEKLLAETPAGTPVDIAALLALARAPRIGMGHYVRNSHETCIIAARPGAASRVLAHDVPSVFYAPQAEHSAKPEVFYRLVERLCPNPYLELFARRAQPGWTAIGDELGAMLDLPLAPTRLS